MYCSAHKYVKIEMPKPNENILEFKNFNHSVKFPFVVYAGFECMLQKIQTCQPSDETLYTNAYQKHIPNNFAYYIKYCNENFKPPVKYSGIGAANVFCEKIKEDALHISKKYYDAIIPMKPLTEKEQTEFKTQKICHICEKTFDDFSRKVIDYDHLTGRFRGAAHNSCNLNYQDPRFIPIFFHNLAGYDAHLFIK
jgi:hypothetical protein